MRSLTDLARRGLDRISDLVYAQRFGKLLSTRMPRPGGASGLVVIAAREGHIKGNLLFTKALESAGYDVVMLIPRGHGLERFCRLNPHLQVRFRDEFYHDRPDRRSTGEPLVSLEDAFRRHYHGVRIGKLACSAYLSWRREGHVDFSSTVVRRKLDSYLYRSILATHVAERVLEKTCATALCVNGLDYTPYSELVEVGLARDLDCVSCLPFRDGILLHRFTPQNLDQDSAAISDALWAKLLAIDWTPGRRATARALVSGAYTRARILADIAPTTLSLVGAAQLRRRLGLRSGVKTVVLFEHVPWDSPFLTGTNLFEDYDDWLAETVRAANTADAVDWVVKCHPVNDSAAGTTAGLLRRRVGPLRSHVKLIPPDTDISPLSLLGIMDGCVTVRGTIGVEAAATGIPVLTAGTGRYEGKGFTIDSSSRDEYLGRLHDLDWISPPAARAVELAERYAYGLFGVRTLSVDSIRPGRSWTLPLLGVRRSGETVPAVVPERAMDARDMTHIRAWLTDPRKPIEYADSGFMVDEPSAMAS